MPSLAHQILEILPALQAAEPYVSDKIRQKFDKLAFWFIQALQAEVLMRGLPEDTPFQRLQCFRKVFYPQLRQILRPLKVTLRMATEDTQDSLFTGYVLLGTRQPFVEFSANQVVADWMHAPKKFFAQKLWFDYVTTIQHEVTHLLQFARFPAGNTLRQASRRAWSQASRQVGPTAPNVAPHAYRQWSTDKGELDPIAAEIVRHLLMGKPAWKNPRLEFYWAYGMEHPATRRLFKKIAGLLQAAERPDLLVKFGRGFREYAQALRADVATDEAHTEGAWDDYQPHIFL